MGSWIQINFNDFPIPRTKLGQLNEALTSALIAAGHPPSGRPEDGPVETLEKLLKFDFFDAEVDVYDSNEEAELVFLTGGFYNKRADIQDVFFRTFASVIPPPEGDEGLITGEQEGELFEIFFRNGKAYGAPGTITYDRGAIASEI